MTRHLAIYRAVLLCALTTLGGVAVGIACSHGTTSSVAPGGLAQLEQDTVDRPSPPPSPALRGRGGPGGVRACVLQATFCASNASASAFLVSTSPPVPTVASAGPTHAGHPASHGQRAMSLAALTRRDRDAPTRTASPCVPPPNACSHVPDMVRMRQTIRARAPRAWGRQSRLGERHGREKLTTGDPNDEHTRR
jgi:hypothetical protein